jgi:hypothetical protein
LHYRITQGITNRPGTVEKPRAVGPIEPRKYGSPRCDVEDKPIAFREVSRIVSVMLISAEGTCVQALANEADIVQVPGIVCTRSTPTAHDFAVQRYPDKAIVPSGGHDEMLPIPNHVMGVAELVNS